MIQFHPYSIVLTVSAIATLTVFLIARRRSAPGSLALNGMLLGMFIWGFSYALSWAFVPFNYKVVWLKIMFLDMTIVPGLFLIFTLRITHRDQWITFRNYVLLFFEPFIILLLVLFAPGFIFKSIEPVFKDGFAVVQLQRGIGFWINTIYSYAVILLSLTLLGISYRNANHFFKKQYLMILLK